MSQNYQGHRKQGKSEKLSQPRGAWGDRMTECSVVFWMIYWKRKGHQVKTKEI